VTGPAARRRVRQMRIASVLRTGLLPSPFSTRSVPIDVGYSGHVPQAIRRAVTARARHCEWPGGCDRPPSACDVHHIRHKKDGGPASVTDRALFCDFHHDICIHRRGWEIDLRADGTTTATSPDGQVLRGHPPPAARRPARLTGPPDRHPAHGARDRHPRPRAPACCHARREE
jgi:hypothetical protein